MPLTLLRHATRKPPLGPLKLDAGHPLTQGLTSFYVLRENGGSIAYDSVLPIINAVFNSSPAWVGTNGGTAIKLNGSNQLTITEPDGSRTAPGPSGEFSVAAMIVRGQQQATINDETLYDHGAGGSYGVSLTVGTGTVNFYDVAVGSFVSGTTQVPAAPAVSLIAGVKAAAGRRVYLNGKLDGSDSATQTIGVAWNNTGYIGQRADGYHNTTQFDGSILWWATWNRALTAAEVASLYAEPYAMFQTRPLQRWLVITAGGGPTTYHLTVSAAQTQTLTLGKQVSLARALSQSQTLSVVAQKVFLRTVSLTQAQVLTLVKQVRQTVATTEVQAVAIALHQTLARTLTAAQAQLATLQKQIVLARAVTQVQTLAVTSRRVFLLVVTAAQAQVVSLRRAVSLTRAVTQTQVAISLRLAMARTLQAAQTTTVLLTRAVRLSRTLTQPSSVTLSFSLGTHVYAITVTTQVVTTVGLIIQHGGTSARVFRVLVRTLSFTVEKR